MKKTFLRSFVIVMLVSWIGIGIAIQPAPVHATVQYTFYASPDGSGSACSQASPCSLSGARTKVRSVNGSMTGDIVVYLRGGTYRLSATFALTDLDSGSNGYRVMYAAYPGEKPVISGGQSIGGWTAVGNGQYQASVGALDFRQLYVNGLRATRARMPKAGSYYKLQSWDEANKRIAVNSADVSNWANLAKVEMVVQQYWAESYMRIASYAVSGGTAYVTPNATEREIVFPRPYPQKADGQTYHFENAYEFLTDPGEWYLNTATQTLYYIPRPGENIAATDIEAPTLDTLVSIQGSSLSNPAHHIAFTGITFAYTTWMRPTGYGQLDMQAGQYDLSADGANHQYVGRPPSAVYVRNADSMLFERNTFTNLGATALDLHSGVHDNTVVGNVVTDVSGNGISLGKFSDEAVETQTLYNPPTSPAGEDARELATGNTIRNNYISRIGQDYYGSVGIVAGWVRSTSIEHNEIVDLPYSGISVGWGWTYSANAMQGNLIRYNHIHNVMTMLSDGGGIYTLSNQPGTMIDGNYIHDIVRSPYAGSFPIRGIYLDFGSSGMTVQNNVIQNTPESIGIVNAANTFANNASTDAGLIAGAGIESAYRDIRNSTAVVSSYLRIAEASSTYAAGFDAGQAFDGDLSTGWSPTGADSSPWLQVDLGEPIRLERISLVTRQDFNQSFERQNFEVRASNDPNFATYTVLGGQGNTPVAFRGTWTVGVLNTHPFRYVRVVKTTNEYFWVTELQVIRKPGSEIANRAQGQAVSSSSDYNAYYPASAAVDGKAASGWSPTGADTSPWLQVNLGAPARIDRINVISRYDIDQPVTRQNFEVRASNDPTFATYTVLGGQGNTPFPHQGIWSLPVTNPNAYQYVRVAKTANEYFFVAELQVVQGLNETMANKAFGRSASASSVYAAGYEAGRGNDGLASGWSPTGADTSPWWQVDLGAPTGIGQVRLVSRQDVDQPETRRNFEVRASNDPSFGSYTVLGGQGNTSFGHQATWSLNVGDRTAYRYIRVAKTVNEYFWVTELEIY